MFELTMLRRKYRNELESEGNPTIEVTLEKQFTSWFKKHVTCYCRIFNKALGLDEVVLTWLFTCTDCKKPIHSWRRCQC
jgi:hypothetical protein